MNKHSLPEATIRAKWNVCEMDFLTEKVNYHDLPRTNNLYIFYKEKNALFYELVIDNILRKNLDFSCLFLYFFISLFLYFFISLFLYFFLSFFIDINH